VSAIITAESRPNAANTGVETPYVDRWGQGFPFDVPALAAVEDLRLERPVTILAGENGSGKSTVLEAVAEAIGFGAEGGELDRLGELPAVPRSVLGGALVPVLSATKPRNGYYLHHGRRRRESRRRRPTASDLSCGRSSVETAAAPEPGGPPEAQSASVVDPSPIAGES
jgi:hypothetical protein